MRLLRASLLAIIFAHLPSQSFAQYSPRDIVEETNRRMYDYCAQGVTAFCGDGGASSRSSAQGPVDKAFSSAFGQLLGAWLHGQTHVRLGGPAIAAKKARAGLDYAECVKEFATNQRKYIRAERPWLPRFFLPKDELWVVVYRRKDVIEAVSVGCMLATLPQGRAAQIFITESGEFIITAGNASVRQSTTIVRKMINDGDYPPETSFSKGSEILDRVWAAPHTFLDMEPQMKKCIDAGRCRNH
jgi:hypothetical protein